MIKRRMPFQALQKATCELLKAYQSAPVYEYVTLNIKPPYLTFGDIHVADTGTKDAAIYTVEMEIYAYSRAHTRREVNEMIDDVATLLSSVGADLNTDGYTVVAQDIADATTSPSEVEGYTGRLLAVFQIQDDK
ncbi:tail completion protein gp17 [Mitsuokella jalaludinii]|uniref:tail completion protein gp17 n=1 Tax=Mitsuokella jalaludinii TaxID=187979 RepID=UPI0030798905